MSLLAAWFTQPLDSFEHVAMLCGISPACIRLIFKECDPCRSIQGSLIAMSELDVAACLGARNHLNPAVLSFWWTILHWSSHLPGCSTLMSTDTVTWPRQLPPTWSNQDVDASFVLWPSNPVTGRMCETIVQMGVLWNFGTWVGAFMLTDFEPTLETRRTLLCEQSSEVMHCWKGTSRNSRVTYYNPNVLFFYWSHPFLLHLDK